MKGKGWHNDNYQHILAAKGIKTRNIKEKLLNRFNDISNIEKKDELIEKLIQHTDELSKYPITKDEIQDVNNLLDYCYRYVQKARKLLDLDKVWVMSDDKFWSRTKNDAMFIFNGDENRGEITIPKQIIEVYPSLSINKKRKVLKHMTETMLHELLHMYDYQYFDGDTIKEGYIANQFFDDEEPFYIKKLLMERGYE